MGNWLHLVFLVNLSVENNNIFKISNILCGFEKHTRNEFDKMLAGRLNSNLKLRLSIIFHDHAYKHSVQPTIHTEPIELHTLNALLKTISRHSKMGYKHFKQHGDYLAHYEGYENLLIPVQMLFNGFKFTFQTPQLLAVAASCLMDFIESAFLIEAVYVVAEDMDGFPLLERLEESINIDDGYQKFICVTYGKRLLKLRQKLEDFEHDDFECCPKIYAMLNCKIN